MKNDINRNKNSARKDLEARRRLEGQNENTKGKSVLDRANDTKLKQFMYLLFGKWREKSNKEKKDKENSEKEGKERTNSNKENWTLSNRNEELKPRSNITIVQNNINVTSSVQNNMNVTSSMVSNTLRAPKVSSQHGYKEKHEGPEVSSKHDKPLKNKGSKKVQWDLAQLSKPLNQKQGEALKVRQKNRIGKGNGIKAGVSKKAIARPKRRSPGLAR